MATVGLDAYVIRERDIDTRALDTVFWLCCGASVVFGTFWLVLREPVQTLLRSPGLAPILAALSLSVVVSGAGYTPVAAAKRLAYGRVAVAHLMGAAAQGATSLVMALNGFGIWSLVWGYCSQELVKTLGFFGFSGFRPGLRIGIREARSAVRFALNVFGDRLLTFATQQSDRLIIGWLLGVEALGFYVLASEIVTFPAKRVSRIIATVLFPALSTVEHDLQRLASGYYRTIRVLSLIMFPFFATALVLAPSLCVALFGDRWGPVGSIVRMLIPAGLVMSLLSPSGAVIYGRGRPDIALRWSALTAVAVPACIDREASSRRAPLEPRSVTRSRGSLLAPVMATLLGNVMMNRAAHVLRQWVQGWKAALCTGAAVFAVSAVMQRFALGAVALLTGRDGWCDGPRPLDMGERR